MTTNISHSKLFRLSTVAAILIAAIALGGCGIDRRHTLADVSQDELSSGGEPYFNVGPVTYQVQESRQLNAFEDDDVQYLAGVKDAQTIGADQLWYGVFLWAKNQTKEEQPTASEFRLVDSAGDVYYPVALDSSVNPYAWTSQTLAPDGIQPMPDSTASEGPAGGGLILFKVNTSVYSNRPLTLEIYAPGSSTPSKVSLDL